LIRPFGFKGGYLTEIWQTACQMQSESGIRKIGLGSQSVLYADPTVFTSYSEAAGNAFMYGLTDKALQMVKKTNFTTPIDLLDKIFPEVMAEGKTLTGQDDLNKIFALNALIGVDNAAWLIYAAENNLADFDAMIPAPYKQALSYHTNKVAVLYTASYNLPAEELQKAVRQGYFMIKIKIGQPGTQAEMLQKDMDRLTIVHQAIKDSITHQTKDGKLIYTMDANARYEKKETLMHLLDHAKKIGAFQHILFIEEPLVEHNDENVADVGIQIAGDESVHDEATAIKRLEQGYGALVLKGIAKTLSLSMKVAQLAHDRGVPCICADLTVNPILIDWHKNLASRLAPFPGLGMGIMEMNGDLNYRNWQTMMTYHPAAGASWTHVRNGVFELNEDFFRRSGGIFEPMPHYEGMFVH
jgi:L-alanine-DL-glutamate epimerase-like enolase superfamily enzyme